MCVASPLRNPELKLNPSEFQAKFRIHPVCVLCRIRSERYIFHSFAIFIGQIIDQQGQTVNSSEVIER